MSSPHLSGIRRASADERGIPVTPRTPLLVLGTVAMGSAFLAFGGALRPVYPFLWVAVLCALLWITSFGVPGRRHAIVMRHRDDLTPWLQTLRGARRVNFDLYAPSEAVLDTHVLPLLRAVADGAATPDELRVRILLPDTTVLYDDDRLDEIESLIVKIRADHPNAAFSGEIRRGTMLEPYALYVIGDLITAEGPVDGPGQRAHELTAYRRGAVAKDERANAARVARKFDDAWQGRPFTTGP